MCFWDGVKGIVMAKAWPVSAWLERAVGVT